MKLRNKKTGEIVDVESLGHAESLKEKNGYQVTLSWATEYENLSQCKDYHSLAELNEEWEDYKPAEPLIKDEKIRKAVRAWYDALDYRIDNLLCIKSSGNTRLEISDGSSKLIYISLFVDKGTLANIKDRTYYTIAELCGEDEE